MIRHICNKVENTAQNDEFETFFKNFVTNFATEDDVKVKYFKDFKGKMITDFAPNSRNLLKKIVQFYEVEDEYLCPAMNVMDEVELRSLRVTPHKKKKKSQFKREVDEDDDISNEGDDILDDDMSDACIGCNDENKEEFSGRSRNEESLFMTRDEELISRDRRTKTRFSTWASVLVKIDPKEKSDYDFMEISRVKLFSGHLRFISDLVDPDESTKRLLISKTKDPTHQSKVRYYPVVTPLTTKSSSDSASSVC